MPTQESWLQMCVLHCSLILPMSISSFALSSMHSGLYGFLTDFLLGFHLMLVPNVRYTRYFCGSASLQFPTHSSNIATFHLDKPFGSQNLPLWPSLLLGLWCFIGLISMTCCLLACNMRLILTCFYVVLLLFSYEINFFVFDEC